MNNTRQPGALLWRLCVSLLLTLAACQAAPSADDAGNAAEAEALILQSAANDLEVRYEAAAALPAEPADLTGGLLTYSPGQLLLGVGPVHILPYPAFISIWGEPRDDSFYARVVLFDVPGDEGDTFDEK